MQEIAKIGIPHDGEHSPTIQLYHSECSSPERGTVMNTGTNPMYGKPGAPSSQTGILVLFLIIICIAIYVLDPGIVAQIHPTNPLLDNQTHHNMTTKQMITTTFGSYSTQAMEIANCESGYNPKAVNSQPVDGSYATGLFQILYPSTWNTTDYANQDPKDAWTNTQAAYQIFKRDGYNWHEWACARIVGLQ